MNSFFSLPVPQHLTPEQFDLVEKVRFFNRVYAQKAGAFDERIFDSPFSLTEARILYELSLSENTTATQLSKTLSLDCGYLSRILNGFEKNGLISKQRSNIDARQRTIVLTEEGREAAERISGKAREGVMRMLHGMEESARHELISAMEKIVQILSTVELPESQPAISA